MVNENIYEDTYQMLTKLLHHSISYVTFEKNYFGNDVCKLKYLTQFNFLSLKLGKCMGDLVNLRHSTYEGKHNTQKGKPYKTYIYIYWVSS